MKSTRGVVGFFGLWLLALLLGSAVAYGQPEVGTYQTLELTFEAASTPANPYDTYLLRLEVTDPLGRTCQMDGFYDGNGAGGNSGNVWRARLSPDQVGRWTWRTIPGDGGVADGGLAGHAGAFNVTASGDHGGLMPQGRYFQLQDGSPLYAVGNFLDFSDGLRTTHAFLSPTTSDAQRSAIVQRQTQFHQANKANVYFANRGDYGSQWVIPWQGPGGGAGDKNNFDATRMDLARWRDFDRDIRRFKDEGMIAEMWFFADDSSFGDKSGLLSDGDRQRLIRYAMARTSGFSHTAYVMALEWGEGFTEGHITELGETAAAGNPWERMLSVHSQTGKSWNFNDDSWPDFIASQAGNGASASDVNAQAVYMRRFGIPHLDEEFGILNADENASLRSRLWANLAGGAAGGGTGSNLAQLQTFLAESHMPFYRMSSANALLQAGGDTFALAEVGHHYLTYTNTGAAFALDLAGSGLLARWYDPQDGQWVGGPFSVAAGDAIPFTPPDGSDWVLWITDGTNPSPGVTHLTPRFEMVQVNIFEPPMTGDADLDSVVDDDDLSIVLANWTGLHGQGKTWTTGDFDGNGAVTDADLSLLLTNWSGAAGGQIPEPTAAALLPAGAWALLGKRRKA